MENLSVAMRALGYFWKNRSVCPPHIIIIVILIIIIIIIIIIIWREQCCQIETLVNLMDHIGT